MKIYTVTYLNTNYGSVMQAYALQKKLIEYGATPVIALREVQGNRLLKKAKKYFGFVKPRKHYSLMMRFKTDNLQRWKYKEKIKKLNDFIHDNINTITVRNSTELVQLIENDTILLAGSDQIWSMINGKLSDWYTYNFSNIPKNITKVSYAASVGLSVLSDEQIGEYCRKLNKFSYISFREEQTRECLKDYLQCPVRCDIDPTLLYDESFWGEIASERKCEKPYVFVYMLRPDKKLIDMAKEIARKKNCDIYYTGLLPDRFKGVNTVYNAGINDFLSYIKYADYVITNSFHGTVFSIVFKRQFVNVEIASTSTRAMNLLKIAHIEDRMISSMDELKVLESKIDYSKVDSFIDIKRKESIEYIKHICSMAE